MNRIAGLETEYGCLTNEPAGPAGVVSRVRNWIFEKNRFGLADLHQRDWDEPAGNGGFLFNGGRCYVDMGHLEYCTPECLSLLDILRYDRAGDYILMSALRGLHMTEHCGFVRNNVDAYSGATFGCHENYLVHRFAPLTESNVLSLLAFLTLRVLYTGAGREATAPGAEYRGDPHSYQVPGIFQISQRADFINNDLFEWVQFNRAIINTRDEPLADGRVYRRLHLLHGDTNVLATALLLKVGTTALVLDLLERGNLPKIVLADAVNTFRGLSHNPDGPWLVNLANGRQEDAVELLLQYYEVARAEYAGRDVETDGLLNIWKSTLVDLAKRPEALVGKVDWITKRWLFTRFVEQEKLSWYDPWLKSQGLEYHVIDPLRSLGLALEQTPVEWQVPPPEITRVSMQPPANTRAAVRSELIRLLQNQDVRYFVDWEVIDVEGVSSLTLQNPFNPSPVEAKIWMRQLKQVLEP